MGHRVSSEICESIVDRVRNGEYADDVAENVGVSLSTAREICREAGVALPRRVHKPAAHYGTDKSLVTRWDDGAEARAERLKQRTVEHHAWLRAHGVEPLVGEAFDYRGCKSKQAEVLQSLRNAPIAGNKAPCSRVALIARIEKYIDAGLVDAEISRLVKRTERAIQIVRARLMKQRAA
jgi:hypothetical protein